MDELNNDIFQHRTVYAMMRVNKAADKLGISHVEAQIRAMEEFAERAGIEMTAEDEEAVQTALAIGQYEMNKLRESMKAG